MACNMSKIKTNYISLSSCLFQNFEKSHTTFFVFSKIDGKGCFEVRKILKFYSCDVAIELTSLAYFAEDGNHAKIPVANSYKSGSCQKHARFVDPKFKRK